MGEEGASLLRNVDPSDGYKGLSKKAKRDLRAQGIPFKY
jgi:hypothetical protein